MLGELWRRLSLYEAAAASFVSVLAFLSPVASGSGPRPGTTSLMRRCLHLNLCVEWQLRSAVDVSAAR
jgi:hypothetical protein